MKGNLRKVIAGDNYSYCIKYVKGSDYKLGGTTCKITDLLFNDDKQIEIFVNDGNSTFLWKTLYKKPLEVEYDVNFE